MTAKATTGDSEDDGILRIGENAEEPKRDVLFRIRGKEYQGIANPSGKVLFRYLDVQRKRGSDIALSWLLEEILDAAAYEAVITDDSLSPGDFDKVTELVRGLVFGRERGPKTPGAPGRSQRRTAG